MRRHPAGARFIGAVAVLGITFQTVLGELRPPAQRRGFTGLDVQRDAGIRRIDATEFRGSPVGVDPRHRGGIGLGGGTPADLTPPREERGEHLVRGAVVLGDPPGRHQVWRARRLQRHPGIGQRLGDRLVTANTERAVVRRDVHRGGVKCLADRRDPLLRATAGDQQPAVEGVVQGPQRIAEELQPARTGGLLQPRIEHEAGQHVGAVGGGLQQRRQVV